VAIVAVILRLVFPALFERIDFIAVALLVIAVVPWIAPYISKISIPGLLEAELRELKEQVQQNKQDVQHASQIVIRSQDKALLSGMESGPDVPKGKHSADNLAKLGSEYVDVRKRMPSGLARTAAMDEIFGRMLKEAAHLGQDWKAHKTWIRSGDAGQQLSAIAYAYAFPTAIDISALVDAVEESKQPFIQYWGLRTIQRALDADSPFSLKDIERLQRIQAALPAGTDRAFLASSINRTIENKLRK